MSCATRSIPGRPWRINEDCYLALPAHGLFAVADGMGGHRQGALASRTALEVLFAGLGATISALSIQRSILEAHARLRALSMDGEVLGCTLTAAWIWEGSLHCFHLGDSRAYLFRDFLLQRLTADHCGESLQDFGAAQGASRFVARALGMKGPVQIDSSRRAWYPGDRVLLLTDGVTDAVSDLQISNVLEQCQNSPGGAVEALLARSRSAGNQDDKTALLVFEDGPAAHGVVIGSMSANR